MNLYSRGITAGLIFLVLGAMLAGCASAPSAATPATTGPLVITQGVDPTKTLPAPGPTFAPGVVNMSFEPQTYQAVAGQEFILTIRVQAGEQLVDTAQASFNYDPAFLSVVEIIPGKTLPTLLQNTFDDKTGTLDYSAGALPPAQPAKGTFDLAQVKFKALTTTPATFLVFQFAMPRQSAVFYQGLPVLATNGALNGTVTLQSQ